METNSKYWENLRLEFPYLKKNTDGAYFDSAATSHKPQSVIRSVSDFYTNLNSNVHRSSHKNAEKTTVCFESSREIIQRFLGAKNKSEIVFTSGATESINLVASTFVKARLKKNDVILVSEIEHHSNILPWQELAKKEGFVVKKLPVNNDLTFDLERFCDILRREKVRFISVHHVSNISGAVQNIKKLIGEAQNLNIPVLVDGAQAGLHVKLNVASLGCDFYCLSGHKLLGPTGTGVLFIKDEHQKNMPPYKFGGSMVQVARSSGPKWAESPFKFEAGTPNIAGTIGFGEAVEFIQRVGLDKIMQRDSELCDYMQRGLSTISGLKLYGPEKRNMPIFSFNIKGVHHYDLDTLLSQKNIMVRSGELCSQGMMRYLNIDGCIRASLTFYNSFEEIDRFVGAIKECVLFLRK